MGLISPKMEKWSKTFLAGIVKTGLLGTHGVVWAGGASIRVLLLLVLAVPAPGALELLRQQRAVAAAAAWVGQVPGGPGPSLQPGSTLSLLKCAEANIIVPKRGQRNINKQKENRVNVTELREHGHFRPHLIVIKGEMASSWQTHPANRGRHGRCWALRVTLLTWSLHRRLTGDTFTQQRSRALCRSHTDKRSGQT